MKIFIEMGGDDQSDDESNSTSSLNLHPVKIIREYDFFDENSPCIKQHRFPLLETNPTTLGLFRANAPHADASYHHHHQYPNSDHNNRKSITSDDAGPSTIRLFGVDLSISGDDLKGKQKMEVPSTWRKTRRNNREKKLQYPAIPPIPPLFHPTILQEEQHPTFLFKKKLQESDVRLGQNRLFIARSSELMGFLSQEEATMVEDKGKNLIVLTTDNTGNQYTMHLTKWHGLRMIVLIHHWFKYVNANELKDGDLVQGWGYRGRDNVFKLALNLVRKTITSRDEGLR